MISGQLEWIGVRDKEHGIISLDSVLAIKEQGLEGDKITLKKSKKRQITLMQKEHINVILSLANECDPKIIRKIMNFFKRDTDYLLGSKPNMGRETPFEENDLILHGHTHRFRLERINECIVFNPGECAGFMKDKNQIGLIDLKKLKTKVINF